MASPKTLVATMCAAAGLLSTVLLAQHTQHGGSARVAAGQATVAPKSIKPAPAGALPPLPRVPFEPARPMPVVQQVYEFAARHPEVLQHVPCFCGCERMGHGGNHDCFVKGRAADGRITEWEAHGIGCQVCIDVGREAMMMYRSGADPVAIRAAIERNWTPKAQRKTPTPMPPPRK